MHALQDVFRTVYAVSHSYFCYNSKPECAIPPDNCMCISRNIMPECNQHHVIYNNKEMANIIYMDALTHGANSFATAIIMIFKVVCIHSTEEAEIIAVHVCERERETKVDHAH
jgi:hypothetical protein